MKAISKEHCLSEYTWGERCSAYTFVDEPGLSVKLEMMPPGSSEKFHFHQFAHQFFHIISGVATFQVNDAYVTVAPFAGIHITPGERHRIINREDRTLEFTVTSHPSTSNDRINLE